MKKVMIFITLMTNIVLAYNIYQVKDISKNGTLSIREEPSINSKKIGELPYNFWGLEIEKCEKISTESSIKNWCKISYNMGWVAKKYIERKDSPNSQAYSNNNITYKVTRVKRGEYLNVRKGIGKKYKIIIKLPYNSKNISILSCIKKYKSSWCYITKLPDNTSDAQTGWVNEKFLKKINQNHNITSQLYRYKEANATIKYLEETLFDYLDNPLVLFKISSALGKAYFNIGKYSSSIGYYKVALSFSKNMIIKDKMFRKELLYHSLGNSYSQVGDYKNALSSYLISIDISNENDKVLISTSLANIGTIYSSLEDYSKAIFYFKKALVLSKNIPKEYYPNIANLYDNIGHSYLLTRKYDEAFLYIKKALDLRKEIFTKDHPDIGKSYQQLGLFYNRIGKMKESIKFYKKALDIKKNILNADNIDIAKVYGELSSSYNFLGKNKKSLKYMNKALLIYEKQSKEFKENHSDYYRKASYIYLNNKKYKESYLYINKSIDIFIKSIYKNSLILDKKQKQKYTQGGEMIMLFVLANQYIIQLKKDNNITKIDEINKELLTHYIKYKGIVTESSNLLNMLYATADKKTKVDIDKLKDLTIQLSNLSQNRQQNSTEQIKSIEEKISKLQIKLNETSAKFREFKKLQNISYKDISKILKKDELYIDFYKLDNLSYVFTLDKSNHTTFKEISSEETEILNKKIQEFRKNNKNKATKSTKETKQTLNEIYTILNKHIDFKSKKSLIISPDGLLNFLPFEALYDGEKYLVESVNISYIPSGRELVRQSRREKSTNQSKDVVIFGDIDYGLNDDTTSNKKSLNLMHYLPQLTSSKEEIDTLSKLYPKAKIYQDKMATIENLFKIKSPKILHLSTHGKFVDDKNTTNPMEQTILAFSDANYAILEKDYRGIATALKLSSLSLNNTELVFLSACETGLGTVQTAEGVQGLPKAFIQAGAKNIIMSLWQVDDNKTTELTRYFYENIKGGMGYKEALRDAKLRMIEMHPYYWSGFIFSGGGIDINTISKE